MRQESCTFCGQLYRLNDLLIFDEQKVCRPCAAQVPEVASGKTKLFRAIDPTICARCEADAGDEPMTLLGNVPVCETCQTQLRCRPFPSWLKISAAVVAAIIVIAISFHYRFYAGLIDLKLGKHYLQTGQVDSAFSFYSVAARHLPEVPELGALAEFCHGIIYLRDDKCQEALDCFNKSSPRLPGLQDTIREFSTQAEMGAAFDHHDFDAFRRLTEEFLRRHPGSAMAKASVASALACQYTVSGNADLRTQALKTLEEAKALVSASKEKERYEEFTQRILYRLDAREVINTTEFHKRFPSGYHGIKSP